MCGGAVPLQEVMAVGSQQLAKIPNFLSSWTIRELIRGKELGFNVCPGVLCKTEGCLAMIFWGSSCE